MALIASARFRHRKPDGSEDIAVHLSRPQRPKPNRVPTFHKKSDFRTAPLNLAQAGELRAAGIAVGLTRLLLHIGVGAAPAHRDNLSQCQSFTTAAVEWAARRASVTGREPDEPCMLFQRRSDRVELARQIGADGGHGADDDDGDQTCDQTIFDGRRAGLVFEETRNEA